jgi:hypothetical protein
MQRNRRSLVLGALAALAVSLGTRTGAQVIVQTFTVPTGTASPFSQNFTFQDFNTSFATLNSVTLSVTGSLLSNVDVFNANGTPTAYSGVTSSIHESAVGPDHLPESFLLITSPALSGTAAPGDNLLTNLAGTKTGVLNIPVADFSFYSHAGGGTGTLTGAGNTLAFNGTATPGLTFTGTGTAGEIITLTYHGTPTIPEPGAATFLVAGALGGIGALIRRRKKS